MLLSIDTSGGTTVAVVDRDRGIIVEHTEPDTRRHAEVIGDLITRCLAESGVEVTALSGVAVGMGPGPFTGLRVGIAAAQAFALGAGRPAVRVNSHDAIASGHYARGGDGPLLVVTDARRREVYWSAYSGVDAEGIPRAGSRPRAHRPRRAPRCGRRVSTRTSASTTPRSRPAISGCSRNGSTSTAGTSQAGSPCTCARRMSRSPVHRSG
jgi:tRNA threonylcarbamoyl adenosine modification protein YeaZ